MKDKKQILHEGSIEITGGVLEPAFEKALKENPPLMFPELKTENGVYVASEGTWSGALPDDCQSVLDGRCLLPIGTCKQCVTPKGNHRKK